MNKRQLKIRVFSDISGSVFMGSTIRHPGAYRRAFHGNHVLTPVQARKLARRLLVCAARGPVQAESWSALCEKTNVERGG